MRYLLVVASILAAAAPVIQAQPRVVLDWQALPDLPRPVSGQFAGVSGGALLVAGGSCFPVPLFEGGKKLWVDDVSVLDPEGRAWRTGFRLQHPLAYGVSITADDSLICIGGGDAERHYRDAFRLRWAQGRLARERLPDLPEACAMMSGALAGRTIYVAGGQDSPAATTALPHLWALDLDHPDRGWQSLPPCPGPARILAAAAGVGDAFHLASGCELQPGPDGKAVRRYLADAWRYRPGRGWERLADLPRPVAAGPALAVGDRVLVFGGDDGANAQRVAELKDRHPGFSRQALAYSAAANAWEPAGPYPSGLVTTTAVRWGDRIAIPGGEDRPGHRSASVLALRLSGKGNAR